MTIIYTNNSNVSVRKLAERFKVPFDDIVKVELDTTHITIYYMEYHHDLTISCTKVIKDSQFAQHLSHA